MASTPLLQTTSAPAPKLGPTQQKIYNRATELFKSGETDLEKTTYDLWCADMAAIGEKERARKIVDRAWTDYSSAPTEPLEAAAFVVSTPPAQSEIAPNDDLEYNTAQTQKTVTFFESIALPLINRLGEVIPLYPRNKQVHVGLVPKPLEMMSDDPKQIRAWGSTEPNANVGVYAKQESGGLLFLDKDGAANLAEQYEKETGNRFPKTLYVRSSVSDATGVTIEKGHWYFLQTPKTLAADNISEDSTGGLFSLRLNNEYVCSIGSIHPKTGRPYEIGEDYPVIPIPDDVFDWLLLQKIQKPKTRKEIKNRGLLPKGTRYPALISQAGRLWEQGHSREMTITASIDWARENFDVLEGQFDEDLVRREVTRVVDTYKQGDPASKIVLIDGKFPGTTAKVESATIKKEITQEIAQEIIDKNFPAYDGKAPEKPRMLIDNFLMGGVNFFGSLSGVGKSWVALAVAKALTTKEPLFGVYPIKEIVPTLYLIPETDESGFKYRMGVIGMTQNPELFRYRTITQGQTLSLTDPLTLAAIKCLHHDEKYPRVLVIIDTAVRFMASGSDEKSATDNTLSNEADKLRSPEVAADLLFLHHSPKASAKFEMTLENVLRGTGDFGAMADCVFGLQRDDKLFDYGDGPEELDIKNVKTRAPETPKPFRVRLKRAPKEGEGDRPISVIKELGTLQHIGDEEVGISLALKFAATVASNSAVSIRSLKDELHISHVKIKKLAKDQGWKQVSRPTFDPKTGEYTKKFVWTNVTVASDAGQVEMGDVIDFSSPEPPKSGKNGRPTTGEKPMSGAERKRRSRAKTE